MPRFPPAPLRVHNRWQQKQFVLAGITCKRSYPPYALKAYGHRHLLERTLKLGNGSFSPTITPRGQCDCYLKQPNYSTFVKHSTVETGGGVARVGKNWGIRAQGLRGSRLG